MAYNRFKNARREEKRTQADAEHENAMREKRATAEQHENRYCEVVTKLRDLGIDPRELRD